MPELPEVETTRLGIAPWLIGHTVRAVVVRDARLRWGVPAHLDALLRGRRVDDVLRRAKYLILRFDQGGDLLIHLGMSGRLRVLTETLAAGKHDHFDLELRSGTVLRLTDPRRFGAVLWAADGAERHERLLHLGPEPLESGFDGEWLFRRSRKRRAPIKQVLMDAEVVVGVGNIYANEALFRAGVRPRTAAARVSRARCDAIAEAIRTVLLRAIDAGGTSFRDFVGSDGKPGYFEQSLNVYGREGEACRRCARALIGIRLGGRATVYCANCQRP